MSCAQCVLRMERERLEERLGEDNSLGADIGSGCRRKEPRESTRPLKIMRAQADRTLKAMRRRRIAMDDIVVHMYFSSGCEELARPSACDGGVRAHFRSRRSVCFY